jgi:hypothetical protein
VTIASPADRHGRCVGTCHSFNVLLAASTRGRLATDTKLVVAFASQLQNIPLIIHIIHHFWRSSFVGCRQDSLHRSLYLCVCCGRASSKTNGHEEATSISLLSKISCDGACEKTASDVCIASSVGSKVKSCGGQLEQCSKVWKEKKGSIRYTESTLLVKDPGELGGPGKGSSRKLTLEMCVFFSSSCYYSRNFLD